MEYLKHNDEITNMIARDLTGIRSENPDLEELLSQTVFPAHPGMAATITLMEDAIWLGGKS